MAARKTPARGAKPDKLWSDALRRAVMRSSDIVKGKKRLEVMADQCAKQAEEGDMQAIKEIGDRLDGKPIQQLAGTNDDGSAGPLIVEITKFKQD